MPKRKAADGHEQNGGEDAKKPCCAAGATAVPDATNGDGSFAAALQRANLAQHMVAQTLKLADAIQKVDGTYMQRTQAVIDLLQADADRSDSLIDLSLVVEGEKLLRFLHSTCIFTFNSKKTDKAMAKQIIADKVLPLVPKLLRSFDPTTVDAATGNNALHELCRLFPRATENDWPHKLAKLLIDHGVSVHARNKHGRTPLLEWATSVGENFSSASTLRLLLSHGADLNEQDNNGDGLLHLLIDNNAATLLDDMFVSDGLGSLNFALRNSEGQTAADVAAIQLEDQADGSADSPERRIHRLVATQTAMWIKHAQLAHPASLMSATQHADAGAAASRDSLQAALANAKLSPRIALLTIQLAGVIKQKECSYTQRVQTVVDLLEENADRPESLIDLSLVVEGEKLLKFFRNCCPVGNEVNDVQDDKNATSDLISSQVLPFMPKLLRSFDPSTIIASTGNNALHEMCRLFHLHHANCFPNRLAELLIIRGVSVHARNKEGRTPLLEWAASADQSTSAVAGLRLLLAHGADPDAQDNDGNGLLHLLVRSEALTVLKHLFVCDEATQISHSLRNSNDQTVADLAAIRLAELQADPGEEEDEDEAAAAQRQKEEQRASQIHQLLVVQAAMWIKHVRPWLLLCLESALPVADVAKLALGYIDGSGRPFATAAEAESDQEDEPAAAAAAAAAL